MSDKGHVYLPACLGKEEPAYSTSLYQTPLFAVSDSGVEAEFSKEDRHQAFSQFQHWCGASNDVLHLSVLELTQGSVGFESSV